MARKNNYKKLAYSILIDLVGMASYFIPAIGETFDVVWAPVSAYFVYRMYGPSYAVANFIEEIAPYTDIVPTATIAWFMEGRK